MSLREELQAALAKPFPRPDGLCEHPDGCFDPWGDVIRGIHGDYSSESDRLMLGALEAVRDRTTFEFIEQEGFAGEFMFYVLAGHGLTDYGTSPRGGWFNLDFPELLDPLIEKWRAYSELTGADDET